MDVNAWISIHHGEKEVIHIHQPYFYTLVVANDGDVIYSDIRHNQYIHRDYIWYRPANASELEAVKRYLESEDYIE